jgi:hypothetical protein
LSQLDGAEQECAAFPEIQKQVRDAFSKAIEAWNNNDYATAKSQAAIVEDLVRKKRNQEPTVEDLMNLAETDITQIDDDALDEFDTNLTELPSTILEEIDEIDADVMNRVNGLIDQIRTIDKDTSAALSALNHSDDEWETQYRQVREETVRQKIGLIREIRVVTAL